jgi:hypothetical protein
MLRSEFFRKPCSSFPKSIIEKEAAEKGKPRKKINDFLKNKNNEKIKA